MEPAINLTTQADIFIVAGTSLVVYPAASLLDYVDRDVPKFIVDPKIPEVRKSPNMFLFEEPATTGMRKIVERLNNLHTWQIKQSWNVGKT